MLFEAQRPYIFGVILDVGWVHKGRNDADAATRVRARWIISHTSMYSVAIVDYLRGTP